MPRICVVIRIRYLNLRASKLRWPSERIAVYRFRTYKRQGEITGVGSNRHLDEIEAAHARGVDVEFDIYPYQCGSTVLTQCLPQWTLDGGNAALLKRLRDPEIRKTILEGNER